TSFALDTILPAAPAGLHLVASSDTGPSSSDGITSVRTPVVQLAAEPGSLVRLDVDGALVGQGWANDPAGWTIGPLADGLHLITATVGDPAGNVSRPSDALMVRIDTQAPAVAIQNPSLGLRTGRNLTVTGQVTDAGSGAVSLQAQIDAG